MNIEVGDIIQIENEKFDVLQKMVEIDSIDNTTQTLIGEHTELSLHLHGDNSLHPTHILKKYRNSERNVLLKIHLEQIVPLGTITPRGEFTRYVDPREISEKDIHIITQS